MKNIVDNFKDMARLERVIDQLYLQEPVLQRGIEKRECIEPIDILGELDYQSSLKKRNTLKRYGAFGSLIGLGIALVSKEVVGGISTGYVNAGLLAMGLGMGGIGPILSETLYKLSLRRARKRNEKLQESYESQ